MSKRLILLINIFLVLALFVPGFVLSIRAAEDAFPPELLSLSYNPKTIDSSLGATEIEVLITAKDDFSGPRDASVEFSSDETGKGFSSSMGVISVDGSVSTLRGTPMVPQFFPPSTYTLRRVILTDKANNRIELFTPELNRLGFPTEVIIIGFADMVPPKVLSFDFNPKVINTLIGPTQIEIIMTAQDDLSGVKDASIEFNSQEVGQSIGSGIGVISVNGNIATLRGILSVQQFFPNGTYEISRLTLSDFVQNFVNLDKDELKTRGFATELLIFAGNTSVGRNVVVGPVSGVTVTFEEVTKAGQTEVVKKASGIMPPTGFKTGQPATYYDISTTAEFVGKVKVCVDYNEADFRIEDGLGLFHFEGAGWVDTTISLNTVDDVLCGEVTKLSEFGLFERISVDYLIAEVKSFNLTDGVEKKLLDELRDAQKEIGRSRARHAIKALHKFIKRVKDEAGRGMGTTQADELIIDAKALANVLLRENSISLGFKFKFLEWLEKLSTIGN